MTEPYLILHKVRGEPAFDVAIKLDRYSYDYDLNETKPIEEVWIIPTSGHRTYPYWHVPVNCLQFPPAYPTTAPGNNWIDSIPMPPDCPDHYACNETPKPKPATRVVSTTEDFLV